jgi:hypothetical protein
VRQRLIDHYPALVEKLVELHRRANKLFTADEDFFAQTVGKGLEEQVLPLEVPQEAVHDVVSVTNHRARPPPWRCMTPSSAQRGREGLLQRLAVVGWGLRWCGLSQAPGQPQRLDSRPDQTGHPGPHRTEKS